MGSLFWRGSLLAAAALLASPALAGVKDGVEAWGRGDYATALGEWRVPAERGDPDALFNLGQAYKLGRGAPQDLAQAERFFGEAATKGHILAADNYGLLLFQRGERAKALPFIIAAAERGERRAQYLLGIAHFNGDIVRKDWVRGYALVSLAQQAGVPQAKAALADMDRHIPLEQRREAVALAPKLSAAAEATRARQLAAIDLEASTTVTDAAKPAGAPPWAKPAPSAKAIASTAPAPARQVGKPAPAPVSGPWRVQLGAFGVAANADALWNRVRNRPELSGHRRLLVPEGKLNKLQAGGFASLTEAQAACARLKAGGFTCIAVRD